MHKTREDEKRGSPARMSKRMKLKPEAVWSSYERVPDRITLLKIHCANDDFLALSLEAGECLHVST